MFYFWDVREMLACVKVWFLVFGLVESSLVRVLLSWRMAGLGGFVSGLIFVIKRIRLI
ncbi:hypothetical protein BU24DRAFT_421686 [Aaosphaeria arxii CBS 175.79]|uniref:Uncharacterized protein n=1 Tax=Aaosphaeria arxii CBS 175.79 TaxID=1450172 RepID=A0A6A5XRD5_9PLEO|nr:uncharacterized protein BU24DRAFT_421686 [Aaosphaeria arxii CBS 175.79]KAF2015397.1 hypothetical protein BU24DRAFT_421686 [Aaosphaeria arxii CBS 175.79]